MSATQRNCDTCGNDMGGELCAVGFVCSESYDAWVPRADAPAAAQEAPGAAINPAPAPEVVRAHFHYFKDVSGLRVVDVYRVLSLFNVTDPCLQHAVKKLLVAGGRGAGKDIARDVQEAIDTLTRWQEMRAEDQGRGA